MEAFDIWWRNVLIAVLGPCFLLSAAITFHYSESTAPLLAGLASTFANASNVARAATQPLMLLPAILREHGENFRF
ncbi:MAG: hypothetical protein ABUS48_03365 [Pseudomonadota bacterium]